MSKQFREFLQAPVTQDHNQQVGKWDVVLFAGNFSPITIDEKERINQFVTNIIRNDKYKHLFSDNVDLGLIVDDEDASKVFSAGSYDLTNNEKEYISGKLFALRMFPISYRRLKWLTLPLPDKHKLHFNAAFTQQNTKDELLTMFYPALEEIKESFDNVNILIVIDPNQPNALPELDSVTTNFEDDTIKIGFISWKHLPRIHVKELGNIPINGDMIKATVLMDHDRPDPEYLKSFAYKYKLGHIIENIRTLHFKVTGEHYLEAFMTMFPDIVVFDDDETNKRSNYKFVMELLKKMYLKDEYVSEFTDEEVETPL
jgi:hypothetical protein